MYLKTLSARVNLGIVILWDFKVNVLVQYFNEPKVGNREEPMRTPQQRGARACSQRGHKNMNCMGTLIPFKTLCIVRAEQN